MAEDAKVTFTGDASQLLAENRKLRDEQDKQTASYKQTKEAARQAAQEERQRAREAAKLIDQTRTSQEKYNAEVAKLDELRKQGNIDEETYNRALIKQQDLLKKSEQAERENTAAYRERQAVMERAFAEQEAQQKKAAQAEEERGRRAKQIYEQTRTPLERYNREVAELNDLHRRGKLDTDSFNRAMAQTRNNLRNETVGANSAAGAFASLAAKMGLVFSVAGTIGMVMNQIRKEIDNIRTRQGNAANTQLEIAGAQREALLNLGIEDPAQAKALDDEVNRIADETGAGRAGLYSTVSTALSFKGADLTDAQAYDAVRAAARQQPGSPEAQVAIAQGILAQMKKGGGSAEQIAGQQMAIKAVSPVASDEAFAKNVAPAVANLTAFGDTTREAGALLATIGQGAGDPTGQMTSTAAVQFAKQLAIAIPQGRSTLERMALIQRDPKLRAMFLGTMDEEQRAALEANQRGEAGELTGEAKAFVTLTELLQGQDNQTQRTLRASLDKIPELAASGTIFNRRISAIDATELQQTAMAARVFESQGEGLRTGDISGARASIGREGLRDLLRSSGASALDQDLASFGFDLKSGLNEDMPLTTVAENIRAREKALRRDRAVSSGGVGAPGQLVPASARDLAEADRLDVVAQKLELVANKLEQNQKSTDENTAATKEATRSSNSPTAAAPPTRGLSRNRGR